MYLLYDILSHLTLLMLLPYFLFKIMFVGKYHKGIRERFGFIAQEKLDSISNGEVIWFHAVSVGETRAVLPLVKNVKEKYPERKVVFSTVTATGNTIAMKEGSPWIDSLIYFPLDLYWVVSRVAGSIKPKVFVVVEKEIWPNVLRILKKNKVPVVVVNGTLSDRSYKRYKLFSFFFKRIFGSIAYFLCQTERDCYKAGMLGIDADKVIVTGNMKFDLEPPHGDSVEKKALLQGLNIRDDNKIIVAGSTHEGEEEIILNVFKRLRLEFLNLRLIIAPRHPERFNEVEGLIKGKGFSGIRRSAITPNSELRTQNSYDVILLDTIGELSKIYNLADVAFVGGSLVDIGGHNLLEPALYKRPVIYGPSIRNCLEMAKMLEKTGGGIRVKNGDELYEKTKELLNNETRRHNAGMAAYGVLEANRGATKKSLKVLEGLLLE